MKYFMLDIETMGLDQKADDVLQIGIVEITKGAKGLYWPGKEYCLTLHTEQEPRTAWIRENHKELIEKCKTEGWKLPPEMVREDILNFFKSCGVEGPANLVGLNLMSFDLPFLMEKGYLKKDDFHYRIYELAGAFKTACDVLSIERDALFTLAKQAASEIVIPEGKKHEALFDCYSQLQSLNGVIRLLRRGMAV